MIIESTGTNGRTSWSIGEDFEISASIIQPTYDALLEQGYRLTKLKPGTANGCGFELKDGASLVSIFFYCQESGNGKTIEGFICIDKSTTALRQLLHIPNEKKEKDFLERSFPDISQAIETNPFFTRVRWVSIKHHCSATSYGQPESKN
ncbi:hypothetical protein [Pelagicoccus albus]|uniref:Uncharacterized protein n=1 Tax=Pelagicoccus albus TaxID=415222 RepID=A0A7X1E769_9BACT|nr:hypothetical protein [Pelagicoccus albus]MBC2604818.1 hypothetical protein [Pelagicoccus albus]